MQAPRWPTHAIPAALLVMALLFPQASVRAQQPSFPNPSFPNDAEPNDAECDSLREMSRRGVQLNLDQRTRLRRCPPREVRSSPTGGGGGGCIHGLGLKCIPDLLDRPRLD